MKSLTFALLILFSLSSLCHAANHDTAFTFSTIETPHFAIHFHQGLEPLARKAAAIAEEVHPKLVREFLWEPTEKTQVVLIDDSDFANGYALPLPYNTIYLQTVPPSLISTIGEYDDWLRVIFTHEYTHIVTSDAARGYSKVTRSIFGKPFPGPDPLSGLLFILTAPPNVFMPHWWHEGMAVWAESEFTGAGRGKATTYDMIFRQAVAENNLPSIDRINGELPDWPDGHLPYLFGYRLQKYITDRYGKETLGKLTMAQSGRFPYFINQPPDKLTGRDFKGLYRDMLREVRREQEARIDILSKKPFTPLRTVYRGGENLTSPRFSPDGSRIAFNRFDPHDHAKVVITDRDGISVLAEFRRLPSDSGSLSWSPDSRTVYFEQAEIYRGFDVYEDLYAFDTQSKEITRLTRGQRLRDIDLSPDGKTFAAVQSYRGSQNLVLFDLGGVRRNDTAKPRQVTDYALERVAAPRWSPDSGAIVYTLTDNAGHTAIHLYDVTSGSDRPLFSVDYNVAFPTWSRDGSAVIYVSDETGVFNIFAYDLQAKKSYQLTHVRGGVMQPEVAPDGRSILVSSYSSRGFSIDSFAADRAAWSEQRGPSIPQARRQYAATGNAAPTGEPLAVDALKVKPYTPWNTLYPHFWLPRISGDGGDSGVYGLFTAGQDVVGYNSYLLTLDYSPDRGRAYYDLRYRNDYFYPSITLEPYAQPFLYGNLLQRGDYYELNRGLILDVSVPVNFIESSYRIHGGYWLQDQQALSHLDANGRFNGLPVFEGRRDNLFAGVDYASNLKYPYSISNEEGRMLSFLYRRYQRGLGSDLNSSEYTASYKEFLGLPGRALKHHVVYLNLVGAVSDGNRTVQQAFQLGGIPSDLNPYSLRGYADRSATGKYLAKGTVEYRFPISYPMHGPGTFPLFDQKLHAALFTDAGEIWDDYNKFSTGKLKVGVGAEVRMDVTIGYWLKVTPALGLAHGFANGGENQIYLTVYADL